MSNYHSETRDNLSETKERTKNSSFSSEETISFSNFKVSFLERKVPLLLLTVVILLIALVLVSAYALFISLKRLGYAATEKSLDIETSCGIIRGVKHHDIFQYLGIPYALPPVKSRRFRKPVELSTKELCAAAWNALPTAESNILIAKNFRSLCLQLTPITDVLIGEEDCLYLNIFAPVTNKPSVLHPVILIIGGFFFNYGGASNGSAFAHQPKPETVISMDAIHVTVNYRLGPLGFLLHPSTNETNIGIRDLLAAIRWVRSNIRHFGGDPLKITLFSYGSGSTMSIALLGSPLAQHTFEKAWIGAPALRMPSMSHSDTFLASQKVFDCSGALCPITSEEITRLWNWSVVEPWIEQMFTLPSPNNQACLPGLPCDGGILVIDGDLISAEFWGKPLFPIPIVIGQNSHEVEAYTSPNTVRLWSPEAMSSYMQRYFGDGSQEFKLINSFYKLEELKKMSRNDTYQFSSVEDTYAQIVTDVRVTCPLQSYANTIRRLQRIHKYFIRSQHPRFNPYGLDSFVSSAFHGWDAFLYFKTFRTHPDYIYAARDSSYDIEKLSQHYCTAVRQFLWHGRVGESDEDTLTIFENNVVFSSPLDELAMCTAWNKIVTKLPFIYAWRA